MSNGKPLRIVHCFRSPVGGIFRHVRDLAEQHSRAGHEVGIVCDSSTGGEHEERLFQQIMPHLSLGLVRVPIRRSVSPGDMAALKRCYNEIKSLQPDVLHGHGAKGGALARVIGSVLRVKRYRVARFYSPHGGSLHFDAGKLSGRGVFALERFFENMSDGILFVCDYERQVYQTKVGTPRCAARMVYNGIQDSDFGRIEKGANGADFMYVGMLRDLKGPDVFIDAFARTERAVGRPLRAVVIGDGPDRDKYDRQMTETGLGQRIDLLPAMPIKQALAMSDVVVIPSRAEAMPYIVLEALAAGKTVIASRVGGIPEVLGAMSEALVTPGDPEALARVMTKSIVEPNWGATTMPKPEEFQSRFSASTMAEGVLDFYQERLAAL